MGIDLRVGTHGFRHALVRAITHRPFRFLLVGALNTLFGYTAFAVGLGVGLTPSTALAAATIVGIAFNFVTSSLLTFSSRDMRRLPAFCLTYGFLFGVNLLALRALLAAGVPPAMAQVLLILPLAALSYLIQRDLVFRTRPRGDKPVRRV